MNVHISHQSDDFILQLSLISDIYIIERFPYAQVILGGNFNTDFNRACNQPQVMHNLSTLNDLIPCNQLVGYDVD